MRECVPNVARSPDSSIAGAIARASVLCDKRKLDG